MLNENRIKRVSKNIDLISKLNLNDSCDCINCSLDVYDFSTAINKMNKYEITNQTTLWEDLVYSYSHYRICDYYKSYNSFKQIEVKANQLKVMEVSFLAKYNMKMLGRQIMNSFLVMDMNLKNYKIFLKKQEILT